MLGRIKIVGLDAVRFFTFPSPDMRRLAKPTARCNGIYSINFGFFKGWHLISDWDGVWVPHNLLPSTDAKMKLEEAVANCESVSILSNCSVEKEREVKEYLATIGMPVNFFRAVPKKPHPEAFAAVFKELGLTPYEVQHNTVYVGDRIYTDVYGAKRAGVGTVVKVHPSHGSAEPLGIRVARGLENLIYGDSVKPVVNV